MLNLLLSATSLLALTSLGVDAADMHRHVARQAAQSTTARASASATQAAASATAAASGAPVSSLPLASISLIGSTTTAEVTVPLPSTYAAGSTPPVKKAPVLPNISRLNPANYPPLDKVPPTNSPEVQAWIAQADLANAPNIPVTGINGCSNSTFNADGLKNAGSNGYCWWTCGGCSRATDISYCPTKDDYGVSFDDGPSPDTPRLLNLLAQQNIKSTFFVVGSRVISRPQMVQTEYMEGHQISVHTWAHSSLTTLTNEQIVAELGWTKKVIFDVIGVTPNTFRPPFGDLDDRVRYIAMKMGLRPIIWTTANGQVFDTKDYQIGAGTVSAAQALANVQNFFSLAQNTLSSGIIVLSHDLYQQSVDLAVNFYLPSVISQGVLKLQTINSCVGEDPNNAYIETNDNTTAVIQSTSTVAGATGTGFVSFAASATTSGSAISTGRSGTTNGAATSPTGTASAMSTARSKASTLSFQGLFVTLLVAIGVVVV
ncbi:BQ2448_3117 [Microbotryum intermedium]|uniref:chitin deacetylase n=1 Tax=Microbotryum intermedium TaxID=269621 RepID=A0A238FFG4_9BASI|nr:BQ2448_3117 [Microbotryum intermedium]